MGIARINMESQIRNPESRILPVFFMILIFYAKRGLLTDNPMAVSLKILLRYRFYVGVDIEMFRFFKWFLLINDLVNLLYFKIAV